jgi:cysteine desulfurase
MNDRPIYLDNNATTPVLPEVLEAMLPYLREHFGNPSSGHPYGKAARQAVEQARTRVASLLGAAPEEILFTSGGTESNNLAIRGGVAGMPDRRHVVSSVVEHPAVSRPCRFLEASGWRVSRLGVDGTGRVRVEEAEEAVGADTALVTIMLANNETGTLQPVGPIAKAARARGTLVHTDAAQAVGKVPVRVESLAVDLLSVAGHKLYAPKGVGALYVRAGTPLEPLLLGAGHERGLRPGTENVPYIVGLGAACALAERSLEEEAARVRRLRDRLWGRLREVVPALALNGHPEERLPNTLNVRFPGITGTAVLALCPQVAASTGSACHEGGESPSEVITAMGIGPGEALGSVRLSLGRLTTEEDVERAAAALVEAWKKARNAAPPR